MYVVVMLLFGFVWLTLVLMVTCVSCTCLIFHILVSREEIKPTFIAVPIFLFIFFGLYMCAYFWLLNEYFC